MRAQDAMHIIVIQDDAFLALCDISVRVQQLKTAI